MHISCTFIAMCFDMGSALKCIFWNCKSGDSQLSWDNINFSWFIALHGHGFHDRAQNHL